MKIIFTIALFGLCLRQGFSQNKLSGKFTDAHKKPVPYLEITASVSDSILRGAVTDTAGVFILNLPQGSYTLKARLFGKAVYEKALELDKALDLGVIAIQTGVRLGEVAVTAQKKLLEQKIDRLVFHVENAIAAAGGDALDALKITPGLRVEDDKISMIGKGSVRVMVDGRLLPLSGADLTSYLQSISADDIKSIEVITTPPARYEAEGNSGLINILLKKNKADYIGGSAFGSYRQQTYADFSTGTRLNYQKGKLSVSNGINYLKGKTGPTEDQTLYYRDFILDNKSKRKDYIDHLGIQSTLNYQGSRRFTTGVSYNFSNSKPDERIDAESRYTDKRSENLDSIFISKNLSYVKKALHDAHGYADYKIDTLGKKISLDAGYLDQQDQSTGELSSELFVQKRLKYWDTIRNTLAGKFSATTFSTDVELPYEQFKLSFGGKLSFANTKNDFKQYHGGKGKSFLDTKASNAFDYTENTQALYGDFSKDWNKLSLKLGLRLENTQTVGTLQSLIQQETNKNNYTQLFPTLYITYKTADKHSFGFNYNRRIGRPGYFWLNPFRRYFSPAFYTEGNPFLQPSFTDKIKLYHDYKNLYAEFWFSKTTGGQRNILLVFDNSSTQVLKPENFITRYRAGIDAYYLFKRLAFLNSRNELTGFHTEEIYKNENVTDKKLEQFTFYFRSNNAFTLNQKKTISAELDYSFITPFVTNAIKSDSKQALNIGFTFKLLQNKLRVSLYANDILRTNKSKGSAVATHNIPFDYDNYYDVRYIKFSLRYNFGRKLNVRERKQNNQEEKNRL